MAAVVLVLAWVVGLVSVVVVFAVAVVLGLPFTKSSSVGKFGLKSFTRYCIF